ncbi:MAG TPA: exodeoxyribonuclease VII small subunit [Solirubrobacteraceae bacterium]|jgi:exodeoxyribonuclease VII small subunit|nr:exodeoxyribonuclease VII small subunit [Solirubrobacteraceae bacterium]
MSESAQSQAIMFEPTDDLALRAVRGEPEPQAADVVEPGLEGAGGARTASPATGGGEGANAREQITFEQGYEELKGIVGRLDDPELPVHEMFEGFRRGKGLEKALRAYLQEREGELNELEEGNNLPEFEIASPSSGPARPQM